MKVQQVFLIILICGLYQSTTGIDASFDGYRYEKPAIPFEIPEFITLNKMEILNPNEKIDVGQSLQISADLKENNTEEEQLKPGEISSVDSQHVTREKEGHSPHTQPTNEEQPLIHAAASTDESTLAQFVNQDQEFIYRLASNDTKNFNRGQNHVQHLNSSKLQVIEPTAAAIVNCDQQDSVECLRIIYEQRSRNRPHARRLSAYTETQADSSYFN